MSEAKSPTGEDGKTVAKDFVVTLYTRPGCHLCEEAKAVIEPLLKELGETLREVNIDEDRELTERYKWDIPVIFIGDRKAAKHRVNAAQFRRQLEEAKRRRGIPRFARDDER